MRYLYSFLFYLLLPFLFLRLLWRSRRSPAYRQRMGERLGFYPFKLDNCIWVHAVSVGEALAAIPLIKALKAQYPAMPLLVTTMTPTGAARVVTAFGDSVKHVFIPYDVPCAMGRFLKAMRPTIAIIMETELWPNLIAACSQRQIPICLVNARLSEKSAHGYQRIAGLTRDMLQQMTFIAAHGDRDAERLIALGARKECVMVSGNIKFDIELAPDLIEKSAALREFLGKHRFIWVAASTHEGEEEMVLAAHKEICAQNPHALLILVPRHPERFDAIFDLCEKHFTTCRRSVGQACSGDTAVYLGDTMGELLLLYGAADVAFIGGSLIQRGGHNMLEPGALGKPIVTGPHLFNFAEISEMFVSAKALTKASDQQSLAQVVIHLMQDENERVAMGQRAIEVMQANRGALTKQMALIQSVIK